MPKKTVPPEKSAKKSPKQKAESTHQQQLLATNQQKEEFLCAAIHNQPRAKQLLQEHPDLRSARYMGETALHYLVVEHYVNAVRFLAENGFDIDGGGDRQTPLMDAIQMGNEEMCKVLLAYGANPNAKYKEMDRNVLLTAIEYDNAALLEMMIQAGARTDWLFTDEVKWKVAVCLPNNEKQLQSILEILSKYGEPPPEWYWTE
jgi:ankyrin repeat protein